MSNDKTAAKEAASDQVLMRVLEVVLGLFLVTAFVVLATVIAATPLGKTVGGSLSALLALDSVQLWWYVTRAAAIVAYLLLWFSTIWGLAVPGKILDSFLDRAFTYDFHQFISLLSIGFMLLHIVVLLFDRYLPYSMLQLLIPFMSPYRPLWVGIGVLSFYVILLVTVTFYMRSQIGTTAFRVIHVLSLLAYVGVTLHGLFAGTDSPLYSMQLLYEVTGLTVVFFTAFWLIQRSNQKYEEAQATLTLRPGRTQRPIRR